MRISDWSSDVCSSDLSISGSSACVSPSRLVTGIRARNPAIPAPTREGTNSLRSSANSSVSDSARAPAMSIAASDIIVTGTSKHDLAALTQLAGDGEDALLRVLHLAHPHRPGRLKFVLHGDRKSTRLNSS